MKSTGPMIFAFAGFHYICIVGFTFIPVIQPGHETAHGEDGDTAIIQLGEDVSDGGRVATHRMIHPRATQANDGRHEEGGKHNLFLPLRMQREEKERR